MILIKYFRGLLYELWSIVHSELDCVRSHSIVLSHPPPVLRSYDFEQIVSARFDGDVMACPVPVDLLTHGEGVLRILLSPGLNLKIIHTLEILNSAPTDTNSVK